MMNNFYGQWLQLRQLDSLTKEAGRRSRPSRKTPPS